MPVALPSQLWKPKMSPNTTKCPQGTLNHCFKKINTERFSGKGAHLPVTLKWRKHTHTHTRARIEWKANGKKDKESVSLNLERRVCRSSIQQFSKGGAEAHSAFPKALRGDAPFILLLLLSFHPSLASQISYRRFFQRQHDMWYYTWNVIIFRKPT